MIRRSASEYSIIYKRASISNFSAIQQIYTQAQTQRPVKMSSCIYLYEMKRRICMQHGVITHFNWGYGMLERIKEREYTRYVVATLNQDGKAMYLHSLHDGEYMLVEEIEYATKLRGRGAAMDFYKFAVHDFGPNVELVLLPVIISYELVKETD